MTDRYEVCFVLCMFWAAFLCRFIDFVLYFSLDRAHLINIEL